MRDLYRAKRKTNDKWFIGSYQSRINVLYKHSLTSHVYPVQYWNDYIITKDGHRIRVDKSTVCQCIGKRDMTGEYIFEHDFLQVHDSNDIVEVKWDNDICGFSYRFFDEGQDRCIYPDERDDFKVIGNFFDNPEMYKALHRTKLDEELSNPIPKEEPIITMENYRDFGLYTKEDVLELIQKTLSKA